MSHPHDSRRAQARCPICRRPAVAAHAPFCSATCRDRDLLAWLEGRYVLPGPPAADAADRDA